MKITLKATASVLKWDADATEWLTFRLGRAPSGVDFTIARLRPEVTEPVDNLITTAGGARIVSLLIGAGGQAATSTSARIGVGNGVGSAAVGDTDLSASAGSSNRQFAVMDATFPSVASNVVTFQASFGSGVANFLWNEYCVDIGAPTVTAGTTVNACLLNHKTGVGGTLGTKTSGSTWALNYALAVAG